MPESGSQWIVNTSDQRFAEDVIERSGQVPVVVDFWAPWCAPCRTLGPVLESLANQMQGQFVLVKANTDDTPQAAAELGVQSIPTVFGVRDRQIVDFFQGALPESQVRSWLERLLPTPAQQLVQEARAIANLDPLAAETKLREALQLDPNSPDAAACLADVLLQQDQLDEASQVVQQMADAGIRSPELERVKARLDLQQTARKGLSVQQAQQRLAEAPEDPQRQLELAESLAVEQQYQQALDVCLRIIQSHRGSPPAEKARQTMVDLFRLLPDDSQLVSDYRRKLSMALY